MERVEVDENNPVYRSEGNCIIDRADNTLVAGCTGSVIPQGVTKIGRGAFMNVPGLKEILLPEGITEIGNNAFGCTEIEKIEFPKSLKKLGDASFGECHLKEIYIPKTLTEIDGNPFVLNSVTKITVEEGHPVYITDKNCLIEKATDTLIAGFDTSEIPDYIKVIGNSAFAGVNLKTVRLPEGVVKLGEKAFSNCHNLSEITFPQSLKEIGELCFSYCEYLRTIIIPAHIEIIGKNVFVWEKDGEKIGKVIYIECTYIPEGWQQDGSNIYFLYSETPEFDTWRYVEGKPVRWTMEEVIEWRNKDKGGDTDDVG